MTTITLFFDRNLAKRLPRGLSTLQPPDGVAIRNFWSMGYANDMADDAWMADVAKQDFVLISQDRKWHAIDVEAAAIKHHGLRCFYLHSAEMEVWNKAELFFKAHRRIIDLSVEQPGPFIYSIKSDGRFMRIEL